MDDSQAFLCVWIEEIDGCTCEVRTFSVLCVILLWTLGIMCMEHFDQHSVTVLSVNSVKVAFVLVLIDCIPLHM